MTGAVRISGSRAPCRQAGFTLLEALIALAIVAVAFAAAFRAFPESARARREARDMEEASDFADSLLAETGPGAVLPGTGESGKFAWRIEAGAPQGEAAVSGPVAAQAIRILVSWPENGQVRGIAVQTVHVSAGGQ